MQWELLDNIPLFAGLSGSEADLLGTTLYPRARMQGWYHWGWFDGPDDLAPEATARGFFPIVRLSRAFAVTYAEQVGAVRFVGAEAPRIERPARNEQDK